MTHASAEQSQRLNTGASLGVAGAGTADTSEIARFTAMADEWWDPAGKFRPLHQINPVRVAFIRDHLAAHFGRDPHHNPLSGLNILDIGCGGGLLGEPLARLGASVTGIDAGAENIAVAKIHAEQSGLDINYRHALPEDLATKNHQFDVVLNMEVVEHVADVDLFLKLCCGLIRPGGVMVAATLNRTIKSLALAKIGAEYVLRWLPTGTHDWRKFVKPSELARGLRQNGVTVTDLKGVSYRPLADEWVLSNDLSVNYLLFATRDQVSSPEV